MEKSFIKGKFQFKRVMKLTITIMNQFLKKLNFFFFFKIFQIEMFDEQKKMWIIGQLYKDSFVFTKKVWYLEYGTRIRRWVTSSVR